MFRSFKHKKAKSLLIIFCHKSPQHHRILSYNEFNFRATPQRSNIEITVQEGAVRQRNAIAA